MAFRFYRKTFPAGMELARGGESSDIDEAHRKRERANQSKRRLRTLLISCAESAEGLRVLRGLRFETKSRWQRHRKRDR